MPVVARELSPNIECTPSVPTRSWTLQHRTCPSNDSLLVDNIYRLKNRLFYAFLDKMSFKKTEKKAKKNSSGGRGSGVSPPSSSLAAISAQSGSGAGGGVLPEGTRTRLLELFAQIEHEFENVYSENAARELLYLLNFLFIQSLCCVVLCCVVLWCGVVWCGVVCVCVCVCACV